MLTGSIVDSWGIDGPWARNRKYWSPPMRLPLRLPKSGFVNFTCLRSEVQGLR